MPPRKPHSKSRRGCLECKRRHTKCNEQHPRCSTCTRLGIDCTWPDWKPRNGSPASPPEDITRVSTPSLIVRFSNVSKSLPDFGTASKVSGNLAIDDLKLLHHFTTKTYSTLDSVVSQQDIWRESLVEIGFRHPFLLRGILAISALHLATLNPDMSAIFVIQATNQHNSALLEFRNVLPNTGEDNCEAVFAFAFITVIHAFAVTQIRPPQEPISDFLNCLRLVQGVAVVLQPHYYTLLKGKLSPILDSGPDWEVQGNVQEIMHLKPLVESMPNIESTTADAYLHAIDLLNKVSTESQKSEQEKSYLSLLFSWPALLKAEFTSGLSVYEPVALIIMAHFVGFLGHKKKVWWILCSNVRIIDDIESRLSPDLIQWLVWPRHMCGTE